jgi:hypothetical protein
MSDGYRGGRLLPPTATTASPGGIGDVPTPTGTSSGIGPVTAVTIDDPGAAGTTPRDIRSAASDAQVAVPRAPTVRSLTRDRMVPVTRGGFCRCLLGGTGGVARADDGASIGRGVFVGRRALLRRSLRTAFRPGVLAVCCLDGRRAAFVAGRRERSAALAGAVAVPVAATMTRALAAGFADLLRTNATLLRCVTPASRRTGRFTRAADRRLLRLFGMCAAPRWRPGCQCARSLSASTYRLVRPAARPPGNVACRIPRSRSDHPRALRDRRYAQTSHGRKRNLSRAGRSG